jgi:hypothetical protein
MIDLTAINEKTIYLVYNADLYNNTGKIETILTTENLFYAKKLCSMNKSFNYSSYPPFCYAKNK